MYILDKVEFTINKSKLETKVINPLIILSRSQYENYMDLVITDHPLRNINAKT